MVKRQPIPKSNDELRKLGIPTVVDRFIQQALLHFLQPMFDPGFSEGSYGLRPGRRAHDAVVQAQQGRRIVVDANLRLRVNESKSASDFATNRKLLGYSFWFGPKSTVKRRVAKKALTKMKERVLLITRRSGGRSMEQVAKELRSYLLGWNSGMLINEAFPMRYFDRLGIPRLAM